MHMQHLKACTCTCICVCVGILHTQISPKLLVSCFVHCNNLLASCLALRMQASPGHVFPLVYGDSWSCPQKWEFWSTVTHHKLSFHTQILHSNCMASIICDHPIWEGFQYVSHTSESSAVTFTVGLGSMTLWPFFEVMTSTEDLLNFEMGLLTGSNLQWQIPITIYIQKENGCYHWFTQTDFEVQIKI